MPPEGHSRTEEEQERQGIVSRAESLWKLTASSESDFVKYLLLSTAGGAVATLSFMGHEQDLRAMWGPRVALFAFLLGVVFCGAMLAVRARVISMAYVRFLEDVAKFRKSDISWEELVSRSSPKHGALIIHTLQGVTYACLIVGVAAGVFTVWTRQ